MKWEYAICARNNATIKELNKMGEDRWELVAIHEGHFYLKREADDNERYR